MLKLDKENKEGSRHQVNTDYSLLCKVTVMSTLDDDNYINSINKTQGKVTGRDDQHSPQPPRV